MLLSGSNGNKAETACLKNTLVEVYSLEERIMERRK